MPPHSIHTADLEQRLVSHPLFMQPLSRESLSAFQASPVFAVWGPLSLVKALQLRFTCVEVPGHPRETRAGMLQSGASTEKIDAFIESIESGQSVGDALAFARVAPAVCLFIETTLA